MIETVESSESTIREAVARGVALLDSRYPGWRSRVNWWSLRLDDDGLCVLGQLFGNFRNGMNRLFDIPGYIGNKIFWDFSEQHGFGDEWGRTTMAIAVEWLKHQGGDMIRMTIPYGTDVN